MIQKIKLQLVGMLTILTTLFVLAVPAVANADNLPLGGSDIRNQACAGATNLQINDGSSGLAASGTCTPDPNGTSSINKALTLIINIFSVIVGVVAVVMIVVGAFRYITSGGDSGKVGTAKNTILYALIGLVIVALAQVIVQFVLNKASAIK